MRYNITELNVTYKVYDMFGDSTVVKRIVLVPLYDTRTGLQYPVTKIGEQVWMAKDLSFCETSNTVCWGWGSYNIDTCQNGSITYYTHEEATKGMTSNSNPSRVQGVCPVGWHIPSNSEWIEMAKVMADSLEVDYIDDMDLWEKVVDELRIDEGWYVWRGGYYVDRGSDRFGFHAGENGLYNSKQGNSDGTYWVYIRDAYWLSTSKSENYNNFYVWHISEAVGGSKFMFGATSNKYAVRCVKD